MELLTENEIAICRMASEGLISKQIAERLCVSQQTVKNYRCVITRKLGAMTFLQAVVFYDRENVYERTFLASNIGVTKP